MAKTTVKVLLVYYSLTDCHQLSRSIAINSAQRLIVNINHHSQNYLWDLPTNSPSILISNKHKDAT